jgi:hypothetical protein
MLICVCLRILASSRIPRYDLGRQTPHFLGGSVTRTPDKACHAVRALGADGGHAAWAGLTSHGLRQAKAVQSCGWAEAGRRALCASAALGFRPCGHFKIEKNHFLFSFKFKL